jgi:hypothetical protein
VELLPHSQSHGFTTLTAVTVRYAPEGDADGHFVIFDNADAVLQSDYFIQTMLDPDLPAPVLDSAEVLSTK